MAKLLSGDDIYTSMNWPSAWSNNKQLITGSELYSAENYFSVPIGDEITTSFYNYGIDNDDKIISTLPKINCTVNQSRCVAVLNAANTTGITHMAEIVLMNATAATTNSGQIIGGPLRATSWVTREDVATQGRGGAYVFDISQLLNNIQVSSASSNFNLYIRLVACDYDGNITNHTPIPLQNYNDIGGTSFTYVKYTELITGLPYIYNIDTQYKLYLY